MKILKNIKKLEKAEKLVNRKKRRENKYVFQANQYFSNSSYLYIVLAELIAL
jgi:hypothetical protein